jgi:hypothetical protein
MNLAPSKEKVAGVGEDVKPDGRVAWLQNFAIVDVSTTSKA